MFYRPEAEVCIKVIQACADGGQLRHQNVKQKMSELIIKPSAEAQWDCVSFGEVMSASTPASAACATPATSSDGGRWRFQAPEI